MSETSAPTAAATEAHPAETPAASPEFDRAEIAAFGHDDGHAVQVIGKMLVGFFFYSLIVMIIVGLLTWSGMGQPGKRSTDAHHAEEVEE